MDDRSPLLRPVPAMVGSPGEYGTAAAAVAPLSPRHSPHRPSAGEQPQPSVAWSPPPEDVYAYFVGGGAWYMQVSLAAHWVACAAVCGILFFLGVCVQWRALLGACRLEPCGELGQFVVLPRPSQAGFAYAVLAMASVGSVLHAWYVVQHARHIRAVQAWVAAHGVDDSLLHLAGWDEFLNMTALRNARHPDIARAVIAARIAARDNCLGTLVENGASGCCARHVDVFSPMWAALLHTVRQFALDMTVAGGRPTPWSCSIDALVAMCEARAGTARSAHAVCADLFAPHVRDVAAYERMLQAVRGAWMVSRGAAALALCVWPLVVGFIVVWYGLIHMHKYVLRAGAYWATPTLSNRARWTRVRWDGALPHQWAAVVSRVSDALDELSEGTRASFATNSALDVLFLLSVLVAVPVVVGLVDDVLLVHVTVGGASLLTIVVGLTVSIGAVWTSALGTRRPSRGDDWNAARTASALQALARLAPALVPGFAAGAWAVREGIAPDPSAADVMQHVRTALRWHRSRAWNVAATFLGILCLPLWILTTSSAEAQHWGEIMLRVPSLPASADQARWAALCYSAAAAAAPPSLTASLLPREAERLPSAGAQQTGTAARTRPLGAPLA